MKLFFEPNSHFDGNKHSKITHFAKHNYSCLHIIKYSSGPPTEILGPSEKNLLGPLARARRLKTFTLHWKDCQLLE